MARKLFAVPLLALGLTAAPAVAPASAATSPCRGSTVRVRWPNIQPICRPRADQLLQIVYPVGTPYDEVVNTVNWEHGCGTTMTAAYPSIPAPLRWMGDHCEWL